MPAPQQNSPTENANSRIGRRLRPAFSLPELMIAIVVLGIGMLMVALSFPVGMEQSRVTKDETIAPIITDEAFRTIKLLWDDSRARPWPGASHPYALRDMLPRSASWLELVGPHVPSDVVYLGTNPNPTLPDLEKADSLNTHLQDFRTYPSAAGQRGTYTWSVLFWHPPKSDIDPTPDPDQLQFVFLIQRGRADSPLWISVRGGDDPRKVSVLGDNRGAISTTTALTTKLGVGPTFVFVWTEAGRMRMEVRSVAAVDPAQSVVWLEDPLPDALCRVNVLAWAVPKDPNTGISTLVSRTLPTRTIRLP